MKEFLKNISIRKFWLLKLMINKKHSYLYDSGWINSFNQKKPVDKNGKAIPWISLPLFHFLKERLNNKITMFEYGAGNSTLYFSPLIKNIDSVEHDLDWAKYLSKTKLNNWTLFTEKLDDGNEYVSKSNNTGKLYDIIIVDGRKRVECVKHSIASLSNAGIIILDDSHRDRYSEAFIIMEKNNFKKIDFWGIGAGNIHTKNSTIFYKNENCLGI